MLSGFFPRDVLDETLNLIESVSEGCPTYSCDCEKHWTFSSNFIDKSSIFKHEYLNQEIQSKKFQVAFFSLCIHD